MAYPVLSSSSRPRIDHSGELLKDELDHPRANEEYFKIQLGPLLELESPILAEKWRRITFLYTTGEYILKASTITDLVVHSEERNTLWLSLRERASQSQVYDPDLPDIDIDPKILALILGVSELEGNYHISRGIRINSLAFKYQLRWLNKGP